MRWPEINKTGKYAGKEAFFCSVTDPYQSLEKKYRIAGDPEPVALDMLRMVAADDHIVFGSDFPHSPAKVILMKKAHFDGNPRWDGIRERIYSGNGLVER